MLPRVGFRAIAPGRFAVAVVPMLAAVEPDNVTDNRPGSGMTEDRREPTLAVSEPADGEDGSISADFGGASAASRTSLRKMFLVADKIASCSSGTVSLFFSRNPSTSYVTSTA